MSTNEFIKAMQTAYTTSNASLCLGAAMHNSQTIAEAPINIPLKTLNRHGLIAGSTGSGKTKTIQLLAEKLSVAGVPSLVMDMKGDLSGLALAGKDNAKIKQRYVQLELDWHAKDFPCELLSLSNAPGVPMRATVSEFGPLLFAKMLGLNDNQTGVVSVIFKYADDNALPILDLKDFKKCLNYCLREGKAEIEETYGRLSSGSAAAILRKIVSLEQQGAEQFFCEPSFDIEDLMRTENKKGVISILRLADIQDKPSLFSTFMLSLLAETYQKLPEIGDPDKPKLMIFIDEAHLIFDQASKELLEQLETIVKLIRSKGVGLIFCTQTPVDIPGSILGQLGLKIQHALRAFTAKDRKAIKLTAENYPSSPFYKTDALLTELGIGEALITALDAKARPTALAAVFLQTPQSRMGPLTHAEVVALTSSSTLVKKYSTPVDSESAYEILSAKLKRAGATETVSKQTKKDKTESKGWQWFNKLTKNKLVRSMGNRFASEVARGLLGVLGK